MLFLLLVTLLFSAEPPLKDFFTKTENLKDPAARFILATELFLGIPYERIKWDEKSLLVKLDAVDCMTFLEYALALSQSSSYKEFLKRLRDLRYRGGVISYETRRHFFLDWLELDFKDAGKEVSEEAFLVEKTLNKGEVLKGVPERRVRYFVVPKDALLRGDYKNLEESDLVGVYSKKEWLDVSHIGVVVKKEGKVFIRHASSLYGRVVDEPIEEFLRRSGELVILRRE